MTLDALQARVIRLAADSTAKRTSTRDRLREQAPELAAFVDELRRVFGGARVTYLQMSDGTEFGKQGPVGVVPFIPIRGKRGR